MRKCKLVTSHVLRFVHQLSGKVQLRDAGPAQLWSTLKSMTGHQAPTVTRLPWIRDKTRMTLTWCEVWISKDATQRWTYGPFALASVAVTSNPKGCSTCTEHINEPLPRRDRNLQKWKLSTAGTAEMNGSSSGVSFGTLVRDARERELTCCVMECWMSSIYQPAAARESGASSSATRHELFLNKWWEMFGRCWPPLKQDSESPHCRAEVSWLYETSHDVSSVDVRSKYLNQFFKYWSLCVCDVCVMCDVWRALYSDKLYRRLEIL